MSPALSCNWNTLLNHAACSWWWCGLQDRLKNVHRKWVTASRVTERSAVCKNRHFSRWHWITVVTQKNWNTPADDIHIRYHITLHMCSSPFWQKHARINPHKLNWNKGRPKEDLVQTAASYIHDKELCFVLCQTNRYLFKRYSFRTALCPTAIWIRSTVSLFSSFSW